MAMPPTLRWALARLPMRKEEKERLEREEMEAKGFVPQSRAPAGGRRRQRQRPVRLARRRHDRRHPLDADHCDAHHRREEIRKKTDALKGDIKAEVKQEKEEEKKKRRKRPRRRQNAEQKKADKEAAEAARKKPRSAPKPPPIY